MKIAVFAGTPVDTQMGVQILQAEGYDTISCPLAKNAKEQTKMQYYSKDALQQAFDKELEQAIAKGVQAVVIYCNSLSVAVDYSFLSKKYQIPIITPIESYRKIAKNYRNIVILAANSFSAYRIDEMIHRENPNIRTMTFGMMNLVEAIERAEMPKKISEDLNLKGFIDYLLGISREEDQVEAILVGCTHFPYVMSELYSFLEKGSDKNKKVAICDPGKDILENLKLVYQNRSGGYEE